MTSLYDDQQQFTMTAAGMYLAHKRLRQHRFINSSRSLPALQFISSLLKLTTLVVFIIMSTNSYAKSGFEGRWKVTNIKFEEEVSPWLKANALPAYLEISNDNGTTVARYTDQSGMTLDCMSFLEIIEGHEAIAFGCPPPFKSSDIYSPLHRIKLHGKTLQAITFTDHKIYTWTALRMAN